MNRHTRATGHWASQTFKATGYLLDCQGGGNTLFGHAEIVARSQRNSNEAGVPFATAVLKASSTISWSSVLVRSRLGVVGP